MWRMARLSLVVPFVVLSIQCGKSSTSTDDDMPVPNPERMPPDTGVEETAPPPTDSGVDASTPACDRAKPFGAAVRVPELDAAGAYTHPRLSADDALRRTVIENLLCHGVVVKREIEERFGIAFDETFASALARLEPCAADGLVALSRDEVRATSLGRVFLRNLAMPFDAYLEDTAGKPVFSRTL